MAIKKVRTKIKTHWQDEKKDLESSIWSKIPKKLRTTAVVIFAVSSYCYPIYNIYTDWVRQESAPQVAGATTERRLSIESNFGDRENFSGLDGFGIISDDPFTVSLKKGSNGNIAFYNKVTSSKFAASYSFLPIVDDKANVVLQYDSFFRLIVGEADLKTISLEVNKNYPIVPGQWEKVPDVERGKKQRYIGGDGFLSGNPINVKITSVAQNRSLYEEVQVTYFPIKNQLGGAPQVAEYQYILPTPINPEGMQGKFGIGIIENANTRLELQKLEVQDYNLQ